MKKEKAGKAAPGTHPVEMARVDSLKPHPRNYREHPEDQLAHIAASIRIHGFYRNVVVARDDVILAGHGVVAAAKQAGLAEVPVIRLDLAPDDARALKLLAGDNEIGRMAMVDDRALTELLKELRIGDDLLGTGFNEQTLAALAMVTRPASEIKDFDAAAEWLGMPEYAAGNEAIRLVVTFGTKGDRDAFIVQAGLKPGHLTKKYANNNTWSARWPAVMDEDAHSLRFEAGVESK